MTVRGAVQGVGFRPFVYRLATGLGLAGWVNNSCEGVFLEVEGPRPNVESFLLQFEAEKPRRSFIQSLEASWLDPVNYKTFEIRPSETGGKKRRWCCRTLPRARTAFGKSSSRATGVSAILLPIARIAARVSASSSRFRMIAAIPP